MLIDPITAFAATKSAISIIQQGIKVGKDLTDLASPVLKWANAESHIDIHSNNKGKSMFGKFSSIEQNAIAAHLRKMEIKKMKDELREIFLLYAPNGLKQWEMLQEEIAHQRKLHKEALQKQIKERKKRRDMLIVIGVSIIAVSALVIEFNYLLN
tara:strand:- start:176 stop:640 length:465 start_codon:yes stop_codon:yes gene_type:complete